MNTFKRILLVDDDSISNFITEKLILRENLTDETVTFLNGEETLNYLRDIMEAGQDFPDIIFLDLNMPGMDGWEFLDAYRNFPDNLKHKTRLFMLSSAVDAKDIVNAKNLEEVEDFISKPLTKEDIDIIRDSQLHSGNWEA